MSCGLVDALDSRSFPDWEEVVLVFFPEPLLLRLGRIMVWLFPIIPKGLPTDIFFTLLGTIVLWIYSISKYGGKQRYEKSKITNPLLAVTTKVQKVFKGAVGKVRALIQEGKERSKGIKDFLSLASVLGVLIILTLISFLLGIGKRGARGRRRKK